MNRQIIVTVVISLTLLQAQRLRAEDSIGDAYAKEFTYLKAQKTELENRIRSERRQRRNTESQAEQKLEQLRSEFLSLSGAVNDQQIKLNRLREDLAEVQGDGDVIGSVLLQMQSTLSPYDMGPGTETLGTPARISNGFDAATQLVKKLSSLRQSEGTWYARDGSRIDGSIVEVGNVAIYGTANDSSLPENSGALVPAGGGKFRLWDASGSEQIADLLAQGTLPSTLPIYIFENREVEVAPVKQKTARSVVESGGIVGYIILALGALGLLLALVRFVLLAGSGGANRPLMRRLLPRMANGDIEHARQLVRTSRGSVAGVLADVVANIQMPRASLDDVITESILREGSRLDRFGSLILVIASVAPLLGLLGTVTGMISTFDLITQFGTGDPKLLADGISIALVTTMLGLAVAIPLLLIGNLLSGWAQQIKDKMERAALLTVNEYETGYAQ